MPEPRDNRCPERGTAHRPLQTWGTFYDECEAERKLRDDLIAFLERVEKFTKSIVGQFDEVDEIWGWARHYRQELEKRPAPRPGNPTGG